jgi:DNA-binding NarL/FixJ family response regulator
MQQDSGDVNRALLSLAHNYSYLPEELRAKHQAASALLETLDANARAVFADVQNGLPNKAIAEKEGMLLHSVENIVTRLLKKWGCANREELARV